MSLPSNGLENRQEEISKLAKRVSLLIRELEIQALDIMVFQKSLAKGSFPRSYIKEVDSLLGFGAIEIGRIQKQWNEIFKEVENG